MAPAQTCVRCGAILTENGCADSRAGLTLHDPHGSLPMCVECLVSCEAAPSALVAIAVLLAFATLMHFVLS